MDMSQIVIFVSNGMTDDLTKNVFRWVFLGTFVLNRFMFASRLLVMFSFP